VVETKYCKSSCFMPQSELDVSPAALDQCVCARTLYISEGSLLNSSWFLTPLQVWLFALVRTHTRRCWMHWCTKGLFRKEAHVFQYFCHFMLDTSTEALSHTPTPGPVSCRKVPWPGFRVANQGPYLVSCTGGSYGPLLYMHSECHSWWLEMNFWAMIPCSLAAS
jgi:hypothetical protein